MTGKQPNDEKLQLDDVIFIPKRKKIYFYFWWSK